MKPLSGGESVARMLAVVAIGGLVGLVVVWLLAGGSP